ncbi:MAG TPA: 23S rRNA (uracil(1939)-C(5))-methyltransferase RlmD [Burkholderiales bacterium]|nr:23S rRNA (uracil(1939)-C(5))-methyltransferase RlmD [Burkholderiales bacterium]
MFTEAVIESLDQEGRGIAHVEGKVAFIEDALPGEAVVYSAYRKKPNYELGRAERILRSSSIRVVPRCRYFGTCGGCSMQHLDAKAQVAAKQRILEGNLRHIGKVKAEMLLPAIYGPAWEYRQRARLAVRYVPKKSGVLVGFHEKRSSFVADMQNCEILPLRISGLLNPLRELINGLSLRDRIPQLELAIGEVADVLVLRVLDELNDGDRVSLKTFADRHRVQFYLQPGGTESAHAFYPENMPGLYYTLPEFSLTMAFHPTEYTQVNHAMNRMLVRRAMQLLDPGPGERIADLFCGLGNFTLPAARSGAVVTGIEGDPELARRATENAARNGLLEAADFHVANLFEATEASLASYGRFDKMLLDPPRDGAVAVVKALSGSAPSRIVYISCNPATLARDAAVLVHTKNYQLKAAGVVNMFPHTSHIESIALFEQAK